MFRVITMEREFGCGAAAIAGELAHRLGWKLWDKLLTEEVARIANVAPAAVKRCDERMDSGLHRLAKAFWRGSYERSSTLGSQVFDTDHMMILMQDIMNRIAKEGNAVVVGRGGPFFLRQESDAFHVFLYAPRAEKVRRVVSDGRSSHEADDLVDTVDRERIAFIKHYFNADWPTRSLYHVMLNTAMGNEAVIKTILDTMHQIEGRPKATDYEPVKTPTVQR
jgi:cytidylate kinase